MRINRAGVGHAFDKAAENYDSYAGLQQKIACDLIALVEECVSDAHIALDIGAGTGYGVRLLGDRFPHATVVAVDIAPAMMRQSFKADRLRRAYNICADANLLPFRHACADLIYSGSFVQWCDTPRQLFANLAQLLVPGGWFIFSTYGPKTLHELRSSWAEVDNFPHTLEFLSAAKLSTILAMNGFIVGDCRRSLEVIYHEGVDAVLDNLKGLGAQNKRSDQRQGLTPASKLQRMKDYYRRHYGVQNLVPASYEVLLFSARLPYRR